MDEGVQGSEEVFVEEGERKDTGEEKQANKKYLGMRRDN